jgi:hypothetical protein
LSGRPDQRGGAALSAASVKRAALERASRGTAAWTLAYALYRAYYAFGGRFAMHGTPVSFPQWRRINAIGAALLLATAALALVFPKTWEVRRLRPVLLAFCWIAAVGCISHALIDVVQRIASLNDALTISYPFWRTIDRRAADLQDLFFNEPWFLIEGLLWAVVAWSGALRNSPQRRWWIGSAVVAVIAATTVGLLTAFGAIDRVIIG